MSSTTRARRRRLLPFLAAPLLPFPLLMVPGAVATEPADEVLTEPEEVALVRVVVPDHETIDDLNRAGFDLAHYEQPVDGGVEVHVVATQAEQDALTARGLRLLGELENSETLEAVREERDGTIQQNARAATAVDTLTPLRTEWFTSVGGTAYLNLEVRTDSEAAQVVTASWDGGSVTLQRFVDRGVYMYHRTSQPVPVTQVPGEVTYTSSGGGSVTAPVTKWLGKPRPDPSPHYATGFVDHYMDPTEVTSRIEDLAQEFPRLAEVVDLPHLTNGYRRPAQVTVGTQVAHAFYVTSTAWGHEGGNDLTLVIERGDTLSASVEGDTVTLTVATDPYGNPVSTADEVIAALTAGAAGVLTADRYRTSTGAGVVTATGSFDLTDGLNAPPEISREPFQVKAIRIGEQRDGSRTGVMLYCQEHAREWVTPLTCVETAERLVRNYRHDPMTRQLLRNLDIFIVPTVNPDGGHYSLYDFASQRKSMTNYCGPELSDPAARNNWGVDLNRNFAVGSLHDGYVGASTNCTSGTFAGPEELSEPEARNEVWLTEEFDNIEYAMNTHSYGGYFMWAPGAYLPDRTPLPRPDYGTERHFWEASEHILSAIQDHRGTAIWPGRTGPVIDVLYSAAGNSADHHFYESGIYAWNFEVGADLWDAQAQRWVGVGFQPPFAEGYEEAMEFSNGMIGMLEVALEQSQDARPPASQLTVTDSAPGSVTFTLTANEAARIYYTLDGSRPTLDSPMIQSAGLREGPQEITVTSTTTVSWFAVDIAGNVERRYDPERMQRGYRSQLVRVR